MKLLTRFWLEFTSTSPYPVRFGVTAYSLEDALYLLKQQAALGHNLAPTSVVENVDIRTLDPNHVRPNMAPPSQRGIWYPLGFWPGS